MTIETKKARFTKEELATEFEIGNLEERFNNAKKLVRYRLNRKGTKCWSVYGVYDNRQVKVNGIIKSTAKTGWHNASAKVANDMLAQQCGITLVDFINIEEFMNNREQATNEVDPAEIEQANAITEETDGSEEDTDEENFAAIIPTEDNDYDETDEPEILNADLFVNLYHSPIQERYASVTRTINGEQLHFFHHRLTHISAPALDLEVYFDNGRTVDSGMANKLEIAQARGVSRGIDTKFFEVDLYKKGTCHLKFKDMDLLKKFNIYCGKKSNMLPDDYGREPYSDLDAEHKAVVDSFEGKDSYQETFARKDFYLQSSNQLLLKGESA